MLKKSKHIASLLVLLVFLVSFLTKSFHHHEQLECKVNDLCSCKVIHDVCPICNFEFSIFSLDFGIYSLPKPQHLVFYKINYNSTDYSSYFKYSFLLRAPPTN